MRTMIFEFLEISDVNYALVNCDSFIFFFSKGKRYFNLKEPSFQTLKKKLKNEKIEF
jgi:hypothetical protein